MTTQISGTTGCSQVQAGSINQDDLAANVVGKGPAFSARGTATNQVVTANTLTKVQLPAEDFDTANAFDSVTNYRFQPTSAGYYFLNGVVRSSANTGTLINAFAEIWKNGVTELRGNELPFTSNYPSEQSVVSGLIYLNGTTDYVELMGYISGTNCSFANATADKSGSCYFQGFLARAA